MPDTAANSHNLLLYIDALTLFGVVLLEWLGHGIQWHIFPKLVEPTGKKELKRIPTYIYGVGCMLLGAAGCTLARQLMGLPAPSLLEGLTLLSIAGGLGAVLPRIIKAVRDLLVKAHVI